MNITPSAQPPINYTLGDTVSVSATGAIAGIVVGMDLTTGQTWTSYKGTNSSYPSTALTLTFTPGWYRRPEEPFAPPVSNDVLVAYRQTVEAYPSFTVPVNVSDA